MIEDKQQYEITKMQMQKFGDAIKKFNIKELIKLFGSNEIAKIHFNSLKSIYEELRQEIEEYEKRKI